MDEGAFFREHGWCILRGVVSAARALALAEELDRVFPESLLPSTRVHERAGISALSAALAEQVQLLQDTALVKPARSPARVEWHQDHTYTGYFDRIAGVSVRLALGSCDEESGCLRVVDGSHAWGPRGAIKPLQASEVGDDSALLPPGFLDRVRLVELGPGDASVHHCLTFHGSLENRSDRPRRTLIARLIDARSKLDPAKLPSAFLPYFPTDEAGHLDPRTFPIL